LPGLALGSSGLLLGLIATILVKFGALERKAATYMRADVLEKLNELEVDPDLDVIIGQHVAGLVGRAQRVFKANACLTVSGISD
jgi:hypothetical protein